MAEKVTVCKCHKCGLLFKGTICPLCQKKSNDVVFDADKNDIKEVMEALWRMMEDEILHGKT